jgi:hypothetical protein
MCVSNLGLSIRSNGYDKVAFKVYDVDRDGFISNGELFLVLKMMVGNNLKVCIRFEICLEHHIVSSSMK